MILTTSKSLPGKPNHSKKWEPQNYILLYWDEIQTGRVVVSKRVRALYKKLARDILNAPDDWAYEFDLDRAMRPIVFTEKYCKHSKGKWAGKPVLLELWEKAMMQAVFGFISKETGKRKYTKAILFVARKNGKSLIASCIALYMLTKDGEGGAEVYSLATKKDQSKIIWLEAQRMIKKSPALSKRLKCLVGEIRFADGEGTFKPLGSDSDTLDGLNPSCVCVDELHAIKDKNLVDVMFDGMSTREQPLFLETTTMGTLRENIFDLEYEYACKIIDGYSDIDSDFKDEQLIAFVYELDNRSEWTNEATWQKANPGLGTIKDFDKLREKVERAKKRPTDVANLLCKDFNVRENSNDAWMTFEQVNNETKFDINILKPKYGIGGVDLSDTTDLTAAKVVFMMPGDDKIYCISMYWIARDLLERKVKEDRIPYDVWEKAGYLRLCEGNSIQPKNVTEWFLEVQREFNIYLPWIGFDGWSAKYWVEEMQGYFGKEAMIPVRQGKQTLNGPMKNLGTLFDAHKVIYNNNPIDKWNFCNVAVDMDMKNQTIQPAKGSSRIKRIDGFAALLDAFVILEEKRNDYLNMI
jgi:phage terminase large subunit-like protein